MIENFCQNFFYSQYFPKDIIKLSNEEVFVDCGAYNGDSISKLEQTDVKTSCIRPDAKKIVINVDAIDNIKECEDMTFLKMDIEGSELNALKGAEKTIRKNKPKLAICIYHSDEDMIDIIEWIINLNMKYKLYVRHHSGKIEDTVVYAI